MKRLFNWVIRKNMSKVATCAHSFVNLLAELSNGEL